MCRSAGLRNRTCARSLLGRSLRRGASPAALDRDCDQHDQEHPEDQEDRTTAEDSSCDIIQFAEPELAASRTRHEIHGASHLLPPIVHPHGGEHQDRRDHKADRPSPTLCHDIDTLPRYQGWPTALVKPEPPAEPDPRVIVLPVEDLVGGPDDL